MTKVSELLHNIIYDDILQKIKSHKYDEGDLLPSELKLCEFYNASRTPVRQALQRLYDEGFIVRQAGAGTFVAGRKFWSDIEMGGCGEELCDKGPYLKCCTLAVKEICTDKELSELLNVPLETPTVMVERVRYFHNEPIHYLKHYTFCLSAKDLFKHGNFSSMLAIYDERNIKISATDEVIEAVPANAEIAKMLDVPFAYPLLLINRYTYDEKNNLIEFVYFYIKTNNWKYRAHYRKNKK